MTAPMNLRRMAAAGLAAALSLLLAACLVSPGKFDASLDVRKDGRFTYAYKGEVFVLGLSELMKMAAEGEKSPFEAAPCYSDDAMEKERPCSKDELAEQKANWETEQQSKAEKAKKDMESMKVMMGGLDPSDPKAAEELAQRLRRQYGWSAVTYKGNGLYDVDFKITGTLTHDFAFPTIEKMPTVVPFFVINRRADGTVRLDSPALASDQNSMTSLAGLGSMMAAEKGQKGGDAAGPMPGVPQVEGRFVLTTDAEILANNTDEGPKADPVGKRLVWTISVREKTGPMALLQLTK
jgi:predicted nucleic acid-binding Zn ribbon protein